MRNHKSRLVKPLRAWADTLRRPLFTRMRSHPASRTNEASTGKTVTRNEVAGPFLRGPRPPSSPEDNLSNKVHFTATLCIGLLISRRAADAD